jgi:hypothetical protein
MISEKKLEVEVPIAVTRLEGKRFGRLTVQYYAGQNNFGTACWCCLCDCGQVCRVSISNLIRKPGTRSCGCLRREVAAEKSEKIAEMYRVERLNASRQRVQAFEASQAARATRLAKARDVMHEKRAKSRNPNRFLKKYSLDAYAAADLLRVSKQCVISMCNDGILAHEVSNGEYWVSAKDVSALLVAQERKKKACKVADVMMGLDPETAAKWKVKFKGPESTK